MLFPTEPSTESQPASLAASSVELSADELPMLEPDDNLPTLEIEEPLPTLEEELVADRLPPFPVPWRNPIRCVAWLVRTLFGLASLTLLLAISAAVPIVNFWTLGYFLDVTGRIGRQRQLRAAFPLLGLAPLFGSIVLGTWLCVLPLRLLTGAAADAALIDPGGPVARRWQIALMIASLAMIVHLCLALARGGSLSCFIRPIKNGRWLLARWRNRDYWDRASIAIDQFVDGLNVRKYFSIGWRGFVGSFAWLFIPTAMYATLQNPDKPGQVIITILGGILLLLALLWVPLLQAHFAAQNRLTAFRELRTVRELFRRAPFAWTFAIVLTYLLALPLYLVKAFSPPQDIMWFITIIFVVSIYPAKVALGWAYQRSQRQPDRAWWVWRSLCKPVLIGLVAVYVFLLFFTPVIAEHGRRVLFEHHALLLPSAF